MSTRVCRGDVPGTLTLHCGPNCAAETQPSFSGQARNVLPAWKRLDLTRESKCDLNLLLRLHQSPHGTHVPLRSGAGQRLPVGRDLLAVSLSSVPGWSQGSRASWRPGEGEERTLDQDTGQDMVFAATGLSFYLDMASSCR